MEINFENLTVIGQAYRTGRLFYGCFNDGWNETIDGTEEYCYWDEMAAKAVDADGKEYLVIWHQKQIRGKEIEDDLWDWDNPQSIVEA